MPICLLAGVGFLVSCYLTLYQWELVDTVCVPVFGQGSVKVLESEAQPPRDQSLPCSTFGVTPR